MRSEPEIILDRIAAGDSDPQLLVRWWQLPSRECMHALYGHSCKRLRQFSLTGRPKRDRPLSPSVRWNERAHTIAVVTQRLLSP